VPTLCWEGMRCWQAAFSALSVFVGPRILFALGLRRGPAVGLRGRHPPGGGAGWEAVLPPGAGRDAIVVSEGGVGLEAVFTVAVARLTRIRREALREGKKGKGGGGGGGGG
jgi:hypothetical protein